MSSAVVRWREVPIAERIAALDWLGIQESLDERGFATTGSLLSERECGELARAYADETLFRSRVVMARHGFGRGEYRYFAYPLPADVQSLRDGLYVGLAPIANRWNERMGIAARHPADLAVSLAAGRQAGQDKPTPLVLKYGPGDYNCLHQDIYGEHVFPLQATFLLSAPGADFDGGEFLLVEQRPRMQSRGHVVRLARGEGVVFAVRERPTQGTRGTYRTKLRHGVSTVTRGERYTLGVIFHDAA